MKKNKIVKTFFIFTLLLIQILLVTAIVTANSDEDSNVNRFSYTQKELDKSDLYYFEARYYDAKGQNRFLSVDPFVGSLANPQTLNRYAFCLNNPLKYVDLDGRKVTISQKAWDYDPDAFNNLLELDIYKQLNEETDIPIYITVEPHVKDYYLECLALTFFEGEEVGGIFRSSDIELYSETIEKYDYSVMVILVKELINVHSFIFRNRDEVELDFFTTPYKYRNGIMHGGELPFVVRTIRYAIANNIIDNDPKALKCIHQQIINGIDLYNSFIRQEKDRNKILYMHNLRQQINEDSKIVNEYKKRAMGMYGPWRHSPLNEWE